MKTVAIVAEFNPFHNGHKYIIEKAKELTGADRCLIMMSGDFVQRGAPAIIDKFSRTKMALSCGADMILELPVYYSTGSAEFFAMGAVSILERLGVIDYLCFGSECGDIDLLKRAADIVLSEPAEYSKILTAHLKNGASYAASRDHALSHFIPSDVLSSPNNILAIEYIKALKRTNSAINPITIKRCGEDYNSDVLNEMASATAIRNMLFNGTSNLVDTTLPIAIPEEARNYLLSYEYKLGNENALSDILNYKLLSEETIGFTKYLDITEDFSNKICSNIDEFSNYKDFCLLLKSKDIAYSRISRCLLHILLGTTSSNMEKYTRNNYTAYARVLGMNKDASALARSIKRQNTIAFFTNLKDSKNVLTPLEKNLLEETLISSRIYNMIFKNKNINEYRIPPIIL